MKSAKEQILKRLRDGSRYTLPALALQHISQQADSYVEHRQKVLEALRELEAEGKIRSYNKGSRWQIVRSVRRPS